MGHGNNSKTRKDRSRDPLRRVRDIPYGSGYRRSDLGTVADLAMVRLPLQVDTVGDPAGHVRVVDANHMVICRMNRFADAIAVADRIVRKLNDA